MQTQIKKYIKFLAKKTRQLALQDSSTCPFNSALVSSADNLCKQFGLRSKLMDTLIVFPIEFFEKVDFGKN